MISNFKYKYQLLSSTSWIS